MPPHRTCTRCGETKLITEFHRRHTGTTRYGINPACKICANALSVEYRRRNGKKYSAKNKERYWANPEAHRVVGRAHDTVRHAIKRGNLTRPETCEQCGLTGRIEAAHYDYSEPLRVRWLCKSCHVLWDRAQPKFPS